MASVQNNLPPVFINKQKYEPIKATMTGLEIKQLAGLGTDHELRLLQGESDRNPGEPIADDQDVQINRALHFRAVPKDRNYGGGTAALPVELDANLAELTRLGFPSEPVLESPGEYLVVFPRFPLPGAKYNMSTARLMIRVPFGYPNAALDMFYTQPDLLLASGAIPRQAQVLETLNGGVWRRFSWHRNATWNPGRDTLLTFVSFVEDNLARGE